MSSLERASILGKKRETPGSLSGRRVFESKKEKKKRRLILSDSESDDDNLLVSPRNKATLADSVDAIKVEAKSDLGSELVKRGGEAESKKKDLVDSEVHGDGIDSLIKEKSSSDGSISIEEVKVEVKRVSSVEVADEREKGSIHVSTSKEEIEVESNGGSSSEVVERREEGDSEKIETASPIKEKNSINWLASKEGIKVESETVSRSEAVKKPEGTDRIKAATDASGSSQNGKGSTINKNSVDCLGSKDKMKIDAKKVFKSKVARESEEVDTKKKISTFSRSDQNENGSMPKKNTNVDQLSNKDEMKVEGKKILMKKVFNEGQEAGSNEKSSVFSGVDQKGGDSSSRKNNNSNRLSSKDNIKVESQKLLKSKIVKEREEANSVKTSAELGSERKRSRETLDEEISLKKFRSEPVKHRQEHSMETGEKIVKRKFLKSGDTGCSIEANLGSNSAASVNIQRDESNEKRMQEDLKKKNEPETEDGKWIHRSTARTLRKLKDNNNSSASARRDDGDVSQQKGIKVQRKGGVLRVLPSNKKVAGVEGVHIPREEKENRKSMTSHPALPKERNFKKAISTIKSVKNQLNPGKVSSAESATPGKGKAEMEASCVKVFMKVDSSNVPTDPITNGDTQSKSKASVMTELNTEDEVSEPRSIVKQRVRDQIKKILLDAGWKIELRPRRGRAYEDAVYVPPSGGSGFWSITKAYNAYLAHCKKNNTLSENSCEQSTRNDECREGASPSFVTVPADLLKMLTRNVVNKRGSGKKTEKAKKKLGVRTKGKGNLNIKASKNYGTLRKDNNEGGKARKKRNTHADVIGSTAHKLHLKVRNKKKRGCALLVRGSNQDADADDEDYVPYAWKRTILSWMIDLGIVHVDGKVKYMNKKQTRALLEGSITRDGIRCGCCSKIISIAKFEIHAGSKLHQPYQNVLVEETGISLLQCQLNAWEKQQESERQGFYKVDIEGDDPNDDTCGICGDGGDLICCDGCPSTFHLNCLGIQMLPPGDWHCTNCSCRYCGSVSDAVPKGSGSATYTMLTCSQCDKKYHLECIPETDAISVCSNDSAASFCGKSCKKVFKQLQKLLGVKNDLDAGLSWSLIRRFGEDSSGHPCNLPQMAECNSKIAVAFAVMDECFRPIVDHRSGINLIHNVVYNCGSNINRLSYTGFYTFILERGDEIIAVASVRIHGTRLAEMPFIGTRNMYRRQGMCRQLLNGIESALYSLNVEKLIIPAISELTETWTGVFGFKPLDLSQRQEVRSINMLVFPGTGLLHKPVLKRGSSEEHTTSDGDQLGESVTGHEHVSRAPNKCPMLSPAQPKTCGFGKEVVHLKNEAEGAELGLQTTENSDASPRSEFQVLQHKSSETTCDMDLSVCTKVDQNEFTGEDTIHVNSYIEPNQEADNAASSPTSGNCATDDTSVGHDTVKHRHLLGATNGSSVSSTRPDLPGADKVSADPKYETEAVFHNEPMGEDTFQLSCGSA